MMAVILRKDIRNTFSRLLCHATNPLRIKLTRYNDEVYQNFSIGTCGWIFLILKVRNAKGINMRLHISNLKST